MIKALSITQPWAWLIAQGHKDIENRRWPTAFRGHFLIHASGKWGHEQAMDLESIRAEFPRLVLPPRFDLGGIVGHAEIVDCVSECDSRWFGGPFGFVIVNASPLPFVPWRGELGFFPAGHELLEACGIIPRTDTEATIRRFA